MPLFRDSASDLSHLLRQYPGADVTRAGGLFKVLFLQDTTAAVGWVGEPEDGAAPDCCVYVLPAQADRADGIATAFDADCASALDYMAAQGVDPTKPMRPGCGVFWLLPVTLILTGVVQLVQAEAGHRAIGTSVLALGLLLAAVFRWVGAQVPPHLKRSRGGRS